MSHTSFPKEFLVKFDLTPMGEDEESFVFSTTDISLVKKDDIEYFLKRPVKLIRREKHIIEQDKIFNNEPSFYKASSNKKEVEKNRDSSVLSRIEFYQSAVELLDEILLYSCQKECSDIHIECMENFIRIRLRKNGSLFIYKYVDLKIYNELVTRIKILASNDIAERRKPQDGRFSFKKEEYSVDIRVSSMPTSLGEKIVLRILNPFGLDYSLEGLGISGEQARLINKLLKQPLGLILICGPTGSGKTSTLYTFLKILNKVERNILTIEDPVEFNIEGINQIQVNQKAGLNFETGLISMLRQDPEVLMVGEIRNRETAEIALRSSITGHLVLSTLHTNDSPYAILRLIDMGIEPYMVSAGLIGVISQRLIRLLCPKCKQKVKTSDFYFEFEHQTLYEAVGCNQCDQGYIGRKAVFEMFLMSDSIRSEISRDMKFEKIRQEAINNGMVPLKENIRGLLLSGETSLDEAYKAILTL